VAERGFFAREELFKFCAEDGILGGHPEYGTIPGIEASTGSLGHGLSIGVGMALAAKIDQKAYRTFIVLSDGECNEGSVWEAALHAAKHRLDNLIVFLDYNKMQCYAATKEVLDLEPLAAKWKAFGFEVKEVDGHDVAAIKKAAAKTPLKTGKPSMIICHTLKGKGIKVVENDPTWHHKARLKDDEMKALWSEFESVEEKRS
jgi:transketolase